MGCEKDAFLPIRPYLDAKYACVLAPSLIRDMLLGFLPDTRSSKSTICPAGFFISLGKKYFEHKTLLMAELFYT